MNYLVDQEELNQLVIFCHCSQRFELALVFWHYQLGDGKSVPPSLK